MPASGEAFGEEHPSTYSPDDPDGPNYDPARAWEYTKREAEEKDGHIGELSDQVDGLGDGQTGFYVPGREHTSFGSPIDN